MRLREYRNHERERESTGVASIPQLVILLCMHIYPPVDGDTFLQLTRRRVFSLEKLPFRVYSIYFSTTEFLNIRVYA